MIDVSQWRASIGLWNYCQAASRGSIVFKKYCRPASSGPASDCCQYKLIKATTEDSESDSTGYIQEEKRCTLPAVLFIIGFIVIYFCVLLLKHNSIPPPGHCYCYQVQCTTGDIVTDTLQSVVLPGDINIFSLISRLLLLSGDVELNPGPTVEEACTKVKEVLHSHYATLEEATKGSLSSIMSRLYAKGIITDSVRQSQSYNKMIDEFELKMSLLKDVSELKRHCQVFLECISQGGPTDDAARSLAIEWGQVLGMESLLLAAPIISSTPSPPPFYTSTGNSKDILRTHSVKLTDAITTNLDRVTDALYAEGLIPLDTKRDMYSLTGENDSKKTGRLLITLQATLESSLNPEQYLIDICHVLINQQHRPLTDIATSILHQLGQSIPDNVSSHTVLPSPVDDISNTQDEKTSEKDSAEDLIKSGTLKKWCKEGIMTLTLTRVLMIGPAGSGKTCTQSLLLNEEPPSLKSANFPDPSISSDLHTNTASGCPHTDTASATSSRPPADPLTSLTEAQSSGLVTPYSIVSKPTTDSTPIACKAVKALRIAFDDGTETWKRITRDELLKKLASSLKEAKEKASQQNETLTLSKVSNYVAIRTSTSPTQSILKITQQEETPEEHYDDPGDVFKKIADLLPKAEAQLSEKWVYIVDSGGQPAYQELLPVFTRAATLNVITLDISKDIDEEFEFMYRINGREFPCDRGMKYSNRKIFNSVVSSASAQKSIDIPFVKRQPKHSMSFVLGTHYDVLIEKSNKKDAETKVVEMSSNLMLELPHLENRIISKVHGNSIIYPVDTMEEDSAKRKKLSRDILEIMSKCTEVTIEVDVPIRCFAFELYLEEKAKGKGFVTKDEAIEEGKKLYMDDDEVELALTFLHNSTIILYKPKIQPQLVFVDPQKILDVLSHLLALTYVDYPTAQSLATNVTENERAFLTKKGRFEKGLLKKFTKVFSDDFKPKYFIRLLQHLHLITELKNQTGHNYYFLPSALPAYNNNYDKDLPKSIKPLYYVWLEQEDEWEPKKSVHVPQGIFILFYVHLLEQKEYKVEFTQHSKCCDALSLWIYIEGKRYTLYIINCYKHIEIYFDGRQEYCPQKYCPQVRELITTTINKCSDAISAKRNYANAFVCPNKKKHCYCIIDEEFKQVATCILCDFSDFSTSDETYWCWFGLESTESSSAGIKEDVLLNIKHLHDVRMLLKDGGFSNAEWFDFGLGLGLYHNTLKTIEKDYPRDTNGCVRECLVKWFEKADDVNDKGGTKWSTLIKALEDYNQNATADYIRSKTLKRKADEELCTTSKSSKLD